MEEEDQLDTETLLKPGHSRRGINDKKAANFLKEAADRNHLKAIYESNFIFIVYLLIKLFNIDQLFH